MAPHSGVVWVRHREVMYIYIYIYTFVNVYIYVYIQICICKMQSQKQCRMCSPSPFLVCSRRRFRTRAAWYKDARHFTPLPAEVAQFRL